MGHATRQLIAYARYHRDPRNIATHFVGIPMIAFGIAALLARVPMGGVGAVLPGAHWLVWGLTAVWYLRLGRASITVPTIAALGGLVVQAHPLGAAPLSTWLIWGLGSFVVGWVFQTVGHVWEGRNLAFFDDLRGLLVGPMFLVAEVQMALGLQRDTREAVTSAGGPVCASVAGRLPTRVEGRVRCGLYGKCHGASGNRLLVSLYTLSDFAISHRKKIHAGPPTSAVVSEKLCSRNALILSIIPLKRGVVDAPRPVPQAACQPRQLDQCSAQRAGAGRQCPASRRARSQSG